MAEDIQTAVGKLYDFESGKVGRCPTEEKCDKFQRGASYDQIFYYIEKKFPDDPNGHQPACQAFDGKPMGKLGACINCEMLPTKPGIEKKSQNEEIVQRIERLSLEANLGFPVFKYCSPMELELLLQRQAAKEYHERVNGFRVQQLIEALASRG